MSTLDTSSTPPAPVSVPARKDRVEYYAETNFKNVDLSRHVHLGWGVAGGTALIVFCMAMSGFTQNRSWNMSFLWLQRRVGAQFMTLSYMITDNLLHYYDGDKWVTRDWNQVLSRYSTKSHQKRHITPAGPTFASGSIFH
ncbi:hypothetical protein CEUSTIGMA_g4684.t1 [Chlamydomonas eustigma]|uniref:Uncharacterized protein n=1 Tax=Chlamydomonas eustigma TaxID=1157962 RepID=A0A250X2D5_9CHLO|nr:hypothetical protein CEUSTIGMA_g4684.t1 [Chlamydomonas eustigma]|eukprot:GAX77237.1 hypothetical protein CEUSTIGMA_g4684.t1 [Chlamydomonas eustigma]